MSAKETVKCPCPQMLELEARILIIRNQLEEMLKKVESQKKVIRSYEESMLDAIETIHELEEKLKE